MSVDNIKTDNLEIVYQQAWEQLRFYITWRERLLAGFLAVIVALAIALAWLTKQGYSDWYFIVFLTGAFLSFGFKHLERRNQILTHVCQNVASTIEKEWKLKMDEHTKRNTALAFTINNSYKLVDKPDPEGDPKEVNKAALTHAKVISSTFGIMIWVMIIGLLSSVYWYNLGIFPKYLNYSWINKIIRYVLICLPFMTIGIIFYLERKKK